MATLGNRARKARIDAVRRIAELGRQYRANTNEQTREQIRRQVNDINAAINETRTYVGGKKVLNRTTAQREAAVSRVESFNREIGLPTPTVQRRANDVFKRNVTAASRGSAVEGMSENAVRAFWRATQKAWEGKGSVKERYKEIQQYYGTSDLQLIFDIVVQENADKINVLNKVREGERLTIEEKLMMQEMMREDDDLEKRYRKNDEDSPIVGLVASNIKFMDREEFLKALFNDNGTD